MYNKNRHLSLTSNTRIDFSLQTQISTAAVEIPRDSTTASPNLVNSNKSSLETPCPWQNPSSKTSFSTKSGLSRTSQATSWASKKSAKSGLSVKNLLKHHRNPHKMRKIQKTQNWQWICSTTLRKMWWSFWPQKKGRSNMSFLYSWMSIKSLYNCKKKFQVRLSQLVLKNDIYKSSLYFKRYCRNCIWSMECWCISKISLLRRSIHWKCVKRVRSR